jgi:hypothetical protein
MSKWPAAAASISSAGEASIIVRCSRERGRIGVSCVDAFSLAALI